MLVVDDELVAGGDGGGDRFAHAALGGVEAQADGGVVGHGPVMTQPPARCNRAAPAGTGAARGAQRLVSSR